MNESKIININDISSSKNETENNSKDLYLLLNFSKNFISSTLIEFSKDQQKLNVLSYNKEETSALFDGHIQHIDKAYETLKKNLIKLKKSAGIKSLQNIHVICNVNPTLGNKITTNAITNFIENEVTDSDINDVIQKSLNTNNIPENMKLINLHINKFKIDNNWVSNPLGMNCQRLEVDATSQIINSSYFNNFNKILQKNGLNLDLMRFETDNIIDASLSEEEKELGAVLVYIADYETKVTFIKNSEVEREENIAIGRMKIVEDISSTFKLSFKVSNHLLKNINLISENSKNLGFFEIELPDGKIQEINYELLNNTISNSLLNIFEEVKREINHTKNINNYLNGVIFLKTLDIRGIEQFFNSAFEEFIKDIRSFNNIIQTFDNIYNVELLNGEYALLGMSLMILNEKDFHYNHNIEVLGDIDKEKHNLGINLNNINISKKREEKSAEEGIFFKIKRIAKELW
jgi:cell division protein FtsA